MTKIELILYALEQEKSIKKLISLFTEEEIEQVVQYISKCGNPKYIFKVAKTLSDLSMSQPYMLPLTEGLFETKDALYIYRYFNYFKTYFIEKKLISYVISSMIATKDANYLYALYTQCLTLFSNGQVSALELIRLIKGICSTKSGLYIYNLAMHPFSQKFLIECNLMSYVSLQILETKDYSNILSFARSLKEYLINTNILDNFLDVIIKSKNAPYILLFAREFKEYLIGTGKIEMMIEGMLATNQLEYIRKLKQQVLLGRVESKPIDEYLEFDHVIKNASDEQMKQLIKAMPVHRKHNFLR